jgi:hypothetical protein
MNSSPDPRDKYDWFYWVMTMEQARVVSRWEDGKDTLGPVHNRVNVWHTWQGNLFNNEDSK